MQAVYPTHQFQILWTDRPRQIIHTSPADAGQLGLLLDGEFVGSVNHRFALSSPTRVSALSKKSFSRVSLDFTRFARQISTSKLQ
jgi:hypothetical protein